MRLTKESMGNTLVRSACHGDEEVMDMLPGQDDTNANEPNEMGQTPLWLAARSGHKPHNWTSDFRVDPGLDRVWLGRAWRSGVWVGSGRPDCKPG